MDREMSKHDPAMGIPSSGTKKKQITPTIAIKNMTKTLHHTNKISFVSFMVQLF